jgi:16S rRNA processing protein RimM
VPRSAFPKVKKGEYYEADLLGLQAEDESGKVFGSIQGIYNYGAGPFLEIGPNKASSFMLPFTDEFVPVVDTKAGKVVIRVPEGWLKVEKPPLEKETKLKVKP